METAFVPMSGQEREKLFKALRNNVENDEPITIDSRHTGFVGFDSGPPYPASGNLPEIPDEEVINQIRSIPCHY